MKKNVIKLTLFTIIGFCGCALFTRRELDKPLKFKDIIEETAYSIDTLINNSGFDMAFWGVKIQYAEGDEIIYERNEDKLFTPASNMKLYTTGAGLCLLGPDYRYNTVFYTNGEIEDDGTLNGDLIIRGGADPTWSFRFYDGNYDSLYNMFCDSLKSLGVKRIKGNIIGDDDVFEDEPALGYGWGWDDEPYYYAARISGLSYGENYVDIKISPSKIGELVNLELHPRTDYLKITNQCVTMAGDSSSIHVGRERARNEGFISGVLGLESGDKWKAITVENPTLYAVWNLKEILVENGVMVEGCPMDGDETEKYDRMDYNKIVPLFSHQSPPMSTIIKEINQPSQNMMAETLQRTIGAELGENGSDTSGIKVELDWLSQSGVDTTNLRIADGSGLSRHNLVSPSHTVSLLKALYDHPHGDIFIHSLPLAGDSLEGGTLKNRMKNTPAYKKVRAKTGTINYARSLSGFVTTLDDETVIFSLMVNHYTLPHSRAAMIQDSICSRLARIKRRE